MRSLTRNLATVIALIIVLGSNAAYGQVKEAIDDHASNVEAFTDINSIAGTWNVVATVPTPEGDRSFRALITFSEGGGMIASAQGDILLDVGSPATAGHGAWLRTGNRAFLFTFRQIFYTADGSYDGGNKVRHTAVMNKTGNSWTGQMSVEFFNADDQVVGTGTGSAIATRVIAEPLLP